MGKATIVPQCVYAHHVGGYGEIAYQDGDFYMKSTYRVGKKFYIIDRRLLIVMHW